MAYDGSRWSSHERLLPPRAVNQLAELVLVQGKILGSVRRLLLARVCHDIKLIRLRKFHAIPRLDRDAPITSSYVQAFRKGHGKNAQVRKPEDEEGWDELGKTGARAA